MNENNQNDKNNLMCGCSGTTTEQVLALLNKGIVDMERISRITGAASGCGGCEFDLQTLLKSHQPSAIED